jgi:hypothetical protein
VTVIDLGVPTDHDPGPPPTPRWLLDLGLRRPLAALATAAVCVGLLGAAAPAEPDPTVHVLAGVTGDGMAQIAGDSLVTFVSGPSSQISAYGLDHGDRRWSVQPTDPVNVVAPYSDVIVLSTAPDPDRTPSAPDLWISAGTVTGYDARTGAIRWTRPGGMAGWLPAAVLLITGAATDRTMFTADPATGQTRWQRPLLPSTQWTMGWHLRTPMSADPDTVLELAADGTVTTVDIPTGHASALGRIPAGGTLGFGWQGVLGVRYGPSGPGGQKDPASPSAEPRSFAIFDLAGLTPMWSTPLTGEADLSPCGLDTLCDWSTGERRLDLRTGRDVTGTALREDPFERLRFGRFGSWNVIGPDGDDWLVYANPGTNLLGPGWLGRVDPSDPTMHVTLLVQLPDRVDQCIAGELWLVCYNSNAVRAAGPGVTYAIRRADIAARPPLR